jgi:hypothetical protein
MSFEPIAIPAGRVVEKLASRDRADYEARLAGANRIIAEQNAALAVAHCALKHAGLLGTNVRSAALAIIAEAIASGRAPTMEEVAEVVRPRSKP